jgi:hypothetical protein
VYPRHGGADQRSQRDQVVEIGHEEQEESIEEISVQLWAVPREDKVRVPNSAYDGGFLVWI